MPANNNLFSIAYAYQQLSLTTQILSPDCIKSIWNKLVPPRVKIFVWKFAHCALPTKANFLLRNIPISSLDYNCALCNNSLESQEHLFLHCCKTKEVWNRVLQWWQLPFTFPESCIFLLDQISSATTSKDLNLLFQQLCSTTLWSIWYFRNKFIFRSELWNPDNILQFIQSRTFLWAKGFSHMPSTSFSDWIQFPKRSVVSSYN